MTSLINRPTTGETQTEFQKRPARIGFYLYLPVALVQAVLFALRQKKLNLVDIRVLYFLVWSSFPYVLGFKGRVKGPLGPIIVPSRDKLKSAAYGAFKTNFCYLKSLSTIRPGSVPFNVVVDVGACVGDFSLALANTSRRIVAIEPAAANFLALQSNVKANQATNVELVRVAAHSGFAKLSLAGIDSNRQISHGGREIVTGIALDSLFSELGVDHVDVLKIDVQGHELHVLRGLRRTLKSRNVGVLIVEAHEKHGITSAEVTEFMKSCGYDKVLDNAYLFRQRQLYFQVDGHNGTYSSLGTRAPDQVA